MGQTQLFDGRVARLTETDTGYGVVNTEELWIPGITRSGVVFMGKHNGTRREFERAVKADYGVRKVEWVSV